ncbi:MAG: hypothetical protein ACFFD4_11470 [Candidatus Odinarchaeota archaeon]
MVKVNLMIVGTTRDANATRATRVVASTLGILVGVFGMEHGFFEILQGNAVPTEAPLGLEVDALGFGFIIDAIGPAHEFWPGASEPAFTIIPSFFITGVLAMIVGMLVMIWSVAFIDKKYGARIFFLLCMVLFLVGGGSPPLTNGVIASLVATRINRPLTWWRTRVSKERRQTIARFWPWSIICSVLLSLLGVEIAIFGFPLSWFLNLDLMTILLLGIGNFITIIVILTVITAFMYDIQQSKES